MNTFVLRYLNAKAKAWPYYVNDRAKQRRCIRDNLKTLRIGMATKDAYATMGRGGNSFHYQNDKGSRAYVSGQGDDEITFLAMLGFPVIDSRHASYEALIPVVVRGPLIAYGEEKVDPVKEHMSLSKRPLDEVAQLYKEAGAKVSNGAYMGFSLNEVKELEFYYTRGVDR